MTTPSHRADIPPFCVLGNLYFVGGRAVSVHLVDTGAGLIVIDTGYPDMRAAIVQNILSLGFNLRDIRMILHTHGHYDHTGSTIALKFLSGATTYIGAPDNDIVNGARDLSWATELGHERQPPFDCDMLLYDGDEVTLGGTTVRCLSTPGHTEGTMSFFFNVADGDAQYVAGMHGGVGLNSMSLPFLSAHGLSADCRAAFRAGLHRLSAIPVDITLGNHPEQNDTEGRLVRLNENDAHAFVDRDAWPRFLQKCEDQLDDMLRREAAGH